MQFRCSLNWDKIFLWSGVELSLFIQLGGWVVGILESNAKLNSKLILKFKLKIELSLIVFFSLRASVACNHLFQQSGTKIYKVDIVLLWFICGQQTALISMSEDLLMGGVFILNFPDGLLTCSYDYSSIEVWLIPVI